MTVTTDFLGRLRARRMPFEPGQVWLAGAGPGSLELLTLGALAAVQEADAIIYDALVDDAILDYRKPDCEPIYMGKRGGTRSVTQPDINARIIAEARAGRRVLRLKGGDPLVFARGGEEIEALVAADIPFRILSGVTSAFGAAAELSIPVTMRGTSRAVVLMTGHGEKGEPDLNWRALAALDQPLVIYMGISSLKTLSDRFTEAGMAPDKPVLIVRNATRPDQTMLRTTIGSAPDDAARADLRAPALIFVGDIISVAERLSPNIARLPRSAASSEEPSP